MKLPMPVICECGFSTMDAKTAVEHAKTHEYREVARCEGDNAEAHANLNAAARDMYKALKDLPRKKSILEEAAYSGGDVPKKWINERGQYIDGYNQAIKDCELRFAKVLTKIEGIGGEVKQDYAELEFEQKREERLFAEVEIPIETLRIARSHMFHRLTRERTHQQIIEAVIKGLDPNDRKRLEAYENGETSTVYECIACGTTFREEDGEHRNGYLVCPSCWCEDIREITEQEANSER